MSVRRLFRNGELSEEKIRRLEEVGFNFDIKRSNRKEAATIDTPVSKPKSIFESSAWLDAYEALKLFVETNEHANLPSDYVNENIDFCLHTWLGTQKQLFQRGMLPQRQIQMLEELGVDLSGKSESLFEYRKGLAWNMYFDALRECNEENGQAESIGIDLK